MSYGDWMRNYQLSGVAKAIKGFVSQAASSALNAKTSSDKAAASAASISDGTATDAGALTGAEIVPTNRGAGLLQTTLGKIAAYVLSLVCPQIATFSDIPASPKGFYLVLADETKGGAPTIYFFTASHRYWIAMIQDA